ncbi:TetR/AcrR family transcriptional regulator [Streptomyces sp. NPDC006923]|uniref:TetR/AcrR family transcriptional regulator n=1 Tax=Streptomyces sp. NPDC006923 TaxID=3155355 RepID=UPI0033CE6134
MEEALVKHRRRGAALEAAVLDAAWAEIREHGYAALTVDAVAQRAGTSKPVLYRRWPGKAELARAAVEHALRQDPIPTPDTGSLRGDVIELLHLANQRRVGLAAHLMAHLGDFFRETGTSIASLRETAAAGQEDIMGKIVERAVERGEINPDKLSDRIARLPVDLFRLELLMTSHPVAEETIIEIVDTIYLPLITR